MLFFHICYKAVQLFLSRLGSFTKSLQVLTSSSLNTVSGKFSKVQLKLTLCILIDSPIQSDTIGMGLSIIYFKGSHVESPNYDVFISQKVVIPLPNGVDPHEMPHFAEFHLGHHYLPK